MSQNRLHICFVSFVKVIKLWLYCRQGLRVHYPSQTAAPSRGFPDFLLRAPAASTAEPESGSTTEISESEDEADEENVPAAAEAIGPVPLAGSDLSVAVQTAQPQEGSTVSESGPNPHCII